MKLIILYTANYCLKIESYFGVRELIREGIDVEFWNLSEITAHESLQELQQEGLIIKSFITFHQFDDSVKDNAENALFATFVAYSDYSARVFRILSKNNVNLLVGTNGCIPSVTIPRNERLKLLLQPIAVFSYLRRRFTYRVLNTKLFRPANYALITCNNAKPTYKIDNNTRLIAFNSGDYNFFCSIENPPRSPYIVFLDQYLPFHNDFKVFGYSLIESSEYFRSLNNFFSIVEKKYNCPIVICAHPSAILYKEKDYFQGRQIVYNKTAEYIKGSIGVINQFSTAVSFAVIANKPIATIYTDQTQKLAEGYQSAKTFRDLLGTTWINIDHITAEDNPIFNEVNPELYDKYKWDYLTTRDSCSVSNASIIKNILLEL